MRSRRIVITSIAALIGVLVLIGFFTVSNLRKQGRPDYNQGVSIPGLTGKVTVVRDIWGVPHITAQNEKDLYLVMGYISAQDRMWQMDLLRRVTTGRLSEIFGTSMVKTDLLFRSLQISVKSKEIYRTADTKIKSALDAYARGVNAYLKDYEDNLPVEFTLLGYSPEKWEPVHSLNLIGFMAWDLSFGWKTELLVDRLKRKVSGALLKELLPDYSHATMSFPDYPGHGKLVESLGELLTAQRNVREKLGSVPFMGSNNWAVSGRRSSTGRPILANDMHLGLSAPGIWLQAHQTVPGKLNVTGVVLPGQPIVICGHNSNIAWGMTNVATDDLDFYIEKTDPSRPDMYLYKGKWKKFRIVREVIKIKGEEPVVKKIRFTHRGPVVSELKDEKKRVISIRWLGNEKSNEMRTVFLLNRAKNWNQFKDAVKTFVSISQNIVYADEEGNIGLFNSGGIPIRKKGDGTEVVPGWTGEYEWTGIYPMDKKPYRFNPPSGYVSSANNRTTNRKFPYPISVWGYATSHRIDRINSLLSGTKKISPQDFQKMHNDDFSSMRKELQPAITSIEKNKKKLTDREALAFKQLKSWNGHAAIHSIGVTIAEGFSLALLRETLRDEMGEELFDAYMNEGRLLKHYLGKVLKNRNNRWLDDIATKTVETYDDIMLRAFKETVAFLEKEVNYNQNKWKWGLVHTLTLKHPMGKVKILDFLFHLNRGPFPVPGSWHTLAAFSYRSNKPFEVTHGPSQRHIYTVGSWDSSYTMIPTGVSGIPGSSFYCNQSDGFTRGNYHKDPFTEKAVEKEGVYKAVFIP